MGLSRQQLDSRLAFDYRVVNALKAPTLGAVLAYVDEPSFAADRPISDQSQAHLARLYRVEYKVRTLYEPDQFMDQCSVKFDLFAGGNYPYSSPTAWVISRPSPWSPHFHHSGTICLGEGWGKARGKMLLAQLVIHIAKLLNFDEPGRGPNYVGYNAAATHYWKKQYKGKPLNPNLVYPDLPLDLVHGVKKPAGFSPVKPSSFRSVTSRRGVLRASNFRPRQR